MPKISIIVPIYNMEKYLRQCLESILAQTLQDIEIICINDGSTDSSCEILSEYAQKDGRIKLVDKKNTGYGHSMNMGLNLANADYIGIVEADDFISPETFERLYKLIVKNDGDLVKADWYNYWGATQEAVKNGKISKLMANKVLCAKESKTLLKIVPAIWSALYRKSFLTENQIKFLETPNACYQDTSFAFKAMACAQKVLLTDKAYYYYRQDNSSSSVKDLSKVYCICDEYIEIENFLNSRPDLKEYFETQKYINQYNAYMWNLERIAPEFHEEFIDFISKEFKTFYKEDKITDKFFRKIKKKKLLNLINDPHRFYHDLKCWLLKNSLNKLRQKIVSVKINTSRVSISLFGRQVFKLG